MWQHIQLSEQIRPRDTLACCWDVKQPTNNGSTQKQKQTKMRQEKKKNLNKHDRNSCVYSKKKVTYQAVFLLSNFISTNRVICITEQHELPRAFNSSTLIVYLAVFKKILFHYISRFGFYSQGKIKVVSYFFL